MRGASKASAELGAGPEATGGAGAFIVLGVLAACVAGIAGSVLSANTIKQRQADLAQVTVRQQALAGQAAKLKPYADYDAMAKSRVQTVRDLAGSRFDWNQALTDLRRAVPADVTLKTLSGNVSPNAGAGGGSGALRSAIAAPAITLTGCAPGQTEVARLMARLRDVDGVTRVTLSKSDIQSATAQGSSGTTALAQRNALPCGAGARPDFELVMFFGKATAATTAPGADAKTTTGTAAAAATATTTPTATVTSASPNLPGASTR
jgi:Tfp pilus assembly protein PilN